MKLLIMQSPPSSRHFLALGFLHSPQHPTLKHPQSIIKDTVYCCEKYNTPIKVTINIRKFCRQVLTVGLSVDYI